METRRDGSSQPDCKLLNRKRLLLAVWSSCSPSLHSAAWGGGLTAVNQNLFQLRFADDRFSPQGVGFQPVDWRIADPGWRLESKVRHGRVSPNPPTFISSGLDHGNVSSRHLTAQPYSWGKLTKNRLSWLTESDEPPALPSIGTKLRNTHPASVGWDLKE